VGLAGVFRGQLVPDLPRRIALDPYRIVHLVGALLCVLAALRDETRRADLRAELSINGRLIFGRCRVSDAQDLHAGSGCYGGLGRRSVRLRW
jgi:hypothetical protein